MKFGRVVGGATSGIAQALGALAMGGRTQQQAYDGEMQGQSKLAQAMAQAQQAQAQARLQEAQAADVAAGTARAAARPGMLDTALSGSLGVDVPTLNAERQRLTTGQAPQVPMGPPEEDGGMGVGSFQLPTETRSRIGQALLRMVPAYTAEKDINPQQWAQALGAFRGMDLGDQVLGGQRTAADVGRAQAAVEAKPLYNSDASGAVLDLFGGALATDNPMAQGSIAVKRETAGAQKANAVQSYAAADSSRASAARTRAETPLPGQAPPADFKDTTAIRKEFEDRAEVKNFRQAMPVLDAARNAPNSPQGDLQLIYGVGKVLDPNSVVREGEMSLVIKSGSPAERLDGFVSYLQGGGRLSPKARERLIKALESRTQEYQRDYNTVRKSYEALAQRRGLDTTEVFMNDRTPPPAAPAARTVVRTGTLNGRKVVQYSDGTTDYAD